MKLPKKVRIGPHRWRVKRARLLDDDFGRCDTETLTIWLHDSLPGPLEREVLIHECLHAAAWTYGLAMDKETEERCVNVFTATLLALKQDNPGVI